MIYPVLSKGYYYYTAIAVDVKYNMLSLLWI